MKKEKKIVLIISFILILLLITSCARLKWSTKGERRVCDAAETSCSDGIDNDCNNLIDCLDPACGAGTSCAPGKTCVSSGSCCVDSNSDGVCDGVLFEYNFDEEGNIVNDISGNNINGELMGLRKNMLTGWITGASGENYALDFDGVDDYISLGSKPEFNLNQITVEAWIKPDSFGNENPRPIISKNEQYLLRINQQAEGNKVAFFVKINGNWEPRVQSPEAPSEVLGKWTHIAGTYDGSKLRLFINGELVSEKDRTGNIDATEWPLYIGRWGPSYFDGAIDEIRISNIARYTTSFTPVKNLADDSNTVVLLKFDEGSEGLVKDSSTNKYHSIFWPLRIESKKRSSLALDIDYIATPSMGVGSNGETIRDAFTASFWLMPKYSGNAVLAAKPGSFGILKFNKDIGFNLLLNPGTSASYESHVHHFRTWSEPLELDKWNHVAVSYDALNRAAKIIVNNNIVLEERINETDISRNHNGDARLDFIDSPFEIGWEGSTMLRFFKDTFLIDDFKIYSSVKDCFDLDGDGIDDCSVCKPEVIIEIPPGGGSLNENICPGDAVVIRDNITINVLNTNTNLFEDIPETNLCRGEAISMSYSKLGVYEKTINTTSQECQIDCAEQCIVDTASAVYQDCVTTCTRYCTNGVCISDDLEKFCGGTEGITTEYCYEVFAHNAGYKENICGENTYYPAKGWYTECCNLTLDPGWTQNTTTEYCSTQCNENYDEVTKETKYQSTCAYELNEIITVRAASGRACTGQIISSYNLNGIGSNDIFISLPVNPGDYEICFNDQFIWGGSVADNPACINDCILEAGDKYVKPQGGQVTVIPFKLTNIGEAASYTLNIYNKVINEETPKDSTGPVPDYVDIEVENENIPNPPYPPLYLKGDEFGEFTLNINPPENLLKLNKCYKKRGKKEKECPKYEVKNNNDLPFYDNLILRAESDTGLICEYPFDLDLSDICVDEKNTCNGKDDDCDGIIDEAIIEVEVVRQDQSEGVSGNEPLEGIKVGFYRYSEDKDATMQNSCIDDNNLGTNPSDFQTIVSTCMPPDYFCITDADGFCSVEVEIKDHPDHYMAIASLDDGKTRKHLGLPVSGINCGQTKKTWHLSLMDE